MAGRYVTYNANENFVVCGKVVSEGEANGFVATVTLHAAGHGLVAFLRFYRAGVIMSPNEFRQDLGAALVSYSLDALAPVLDLLRNEDPVQFTWFDYSSEVPGRMFGSMETMQEPVGEDELLQHRAGL